MLETRGGGGGEVQLSYAVSSSCSAIVLPTLKWRVDMVLTVALF